MPNRELEKSEALKRFLKLEFIKETELQEITRLATQICNVPIAIITLRGEDNMSYIKYKYGEASVENKTTRYPFCDLIEAQGEVLIINDASQDPRFAKDQLVIGSPYIRFYAVYPLITQNGEMKGSLAVIGDKPGELTSQQQEMLSTLSRQTLNLLDLDTSLKVVKEQFIEAKSSEIKLRSFFESSNSCHLLVDQNLNVLAFNSMLAKFTKRIFGIEIYTGMPAIELTHSSYVTNFVAHCREALTGKYIGFEQHIIYQSESIWWHITYDPALDSSHNIIWVSYNATDITDRIAHKQKVTLQNEALRKIAFIQSHELRRPVASILGLMNLIELNGLNHNQEELRLLKVAVQELDEKIHLVVGYTSE